MPDCAVLADVCSPGQPWAQALSPWAGPQRAPLCLLAEARPVHGGHHCWSMTQAEASVHRPLGGARLLRAGVRLPSPTPSHPHVARAGSSAPFLTCQADPVSWQAACRALSSSAGISASCTRVLCFLGARPQGLCQLAPPGDSSDCRVSEETSPQGAGRSRACPRGSRATGWGWRPRGGLAWVPGPRLPLAHQTLRLRSSKEQGRQEPVRVSDQAHQGSKGLETTAPNGKGSGPPPSSWLPRPSGPGGPPLRRRGLSPGR